MRRHKRKEILVICSKTTYPDVHITKVTRKIYKLITNNGMALPYMDEEADCIGSNAVSLYDAVVMCLHRKKNMK